MKLKLGVITDNIDPAMLTAIVYADYLYILYGVPNGVTITSGRDGKHSSTSLHYCGRAVDLRIRDLPYPEKTSKLIAGKLKYILGSDYDVILESDHIHIEYDPQFNK